MNSNSSAVKGEAWDVVPPSAAEWFEDCTEIANQDWRGGWDACRNRCRILVGELVSASSEPPPEEFALVGRNSPELDALNQWTGDMMVLQVLADSEHVNDQEREVLTRWMAESSVPVQQVPELTDEQIDAITDQQWGKGCAPNQYMAHRAYAREIERAILAARTAPAEHIVEANKKDASGVPPGEWGELSPKQAWWAGYRVGKGLPPDMPRVDAVAADRIADAGQSMLRQALEGVNVSADAPSAEKSAEKSVRAEELPALYDLLYRIRVAAGDPTGKLMQDELVERIRALANAAGVDESKNALTPKSDLAASGNDAGNHVVEAAGVNPSGKEQAK